MILLRNHGDVVNGENEIEKGIGIESRNVVTSISHHGHGQNRIASKRVVVVAAVGRRINEDLNLISYLTVNSSSN